MDLPLRILRPFLGARIIKTGLAVFLALVAFHWFDFKYSTFAAVASILAVQPSISRARELFAQQLVSNLLGGLVGAVLGYYFGSASLAMAVAVILVLGLCVRLGLNETANTAVVAVIFIMDRPEHDFLYFTAARIGAIVGGMLIGYLVNRFVLPPNFTQRAKEELRAASGAVDTFAGHLLASLAWPEHYRKDQIKQEAEAIERHLDSAGFFLDLHREIARGNADTLLMEKAKASLFVFVEGIMDIHKVALHMGGLRPGPEVGAVAQAVKRVMAYKVEVVGAVLNGVESATPEAAGAFSASLSELEELVEAQVERKETRSRGLALHTLRDDLRHMGGRMDSLARLLAERKAQ